MISPDDVSQSRGEEIANSVSHGLGTLGVLVGAPFLIIATTRTGSPWNIIGASVFLFAMFVLFLTSTLYHGLTFPTAKRIFRVLDHGAIFLLIAGTYTPFTLGVLRGSIGWTIFGVVWGLALLGIVLKATNKLWHPFLSNAIYLGMGWMIVIAARPFWEQLSGWGMAWLLGGGLAYSGGIYFYNTRCFRYAHSVWHLCVMIGAAAHYFAVLSAVR